MFTKPISNLYDDLEIGHLKWSMFVNDCDLYKNLDFSFSLPNISMYLQTGNVSVNLSKISNIFFCFSIELSMVCLLELCMLYY